MAAPIVDYSANRGLLVDIEKKVAFNGARLDQLEKEAKDNRDILETWRVGPRPFPKFSDRAEIAECLEVLVRSLARARYEAESPSVSVQKEVFAGVLQDVEELQAGADDVGTVLFRLLELEVGLKGLEDSARSGNRKYEARLAASLRDICKIHEPADLSKSQIEVFVASVRVLVNEWGELNREMVRFVRSRLLEVGLTWLPVTEKAARDIAKAKKLIGK